MRNNHFITFSFYSDFGGTAPIYSRLGIGSTNGNGEDNIKTNGGNGPSNLLTKPSFRDFTMDKARSEKNLKLLVKMTVLPIDAYLVQCACSIRRRKKKIIKKIIIFAHL